MKKAEVNAVVVKSPSDPEPKTVSPTYFLMGSKGKSIKELFNNVIEWEINPDYDDVSFGSMGIFNLTFDLEAFPGCCGASVLKEFSISKLGKINNLDFLQDLTEFFDQFVKHPLHKGISFTCTTIKTGDSGVVAKALEECQFWTSVKSWTNKKTNNVITMWVSNNP